MTALQRLLLATACLRAVGAMPSPALPAEAEKKPDDQIAERIRSYFIREFWKGTHFAEYWHPQRGFISHHGLTDVDWAALATAVATPEQVKILWPQLRMEKAFYYGGMPTGSGGNPWVLAPESASGSLSESGEMI